MTTAIFLCSCVFFFFFFYSDIHLHLLLCRVNFLEKLGPCTLSLSLYLSISQFSRLFCAAQLVVSILVQIENFICHRQDKSSSIWCPLLWLKCKNEKMSFAYFSHLLFFSSSFVFIT
jgi:hypothetical protein